MRSKFYSTAAWKKMREAHLIKEPVCQFCLAVGRVNGTDLIIDHVTPHRGNRKLFFNRENIQTLCRSCHDSRKRMLDLDGYDPQVGADGWPVDQEHPFHTGKARKKNFLHHGVPVGIQPRDYPTHLICGPPGAGKYEYALERKERAGVGIILNPNTTAERMGLKRESRWNRRKIAEAEVTALNRFNGPAWILRELPDRRQRLAWSDALQDPNCFTVLARSESECLERLEREGRLTGSMRERIRSWWKIYRG